MKTIENNKLIFVLLIFVNFASFGEKIPSSTIKNCKIYSAYAVDDSHSITKKTWQEVCFVLGFLPTNIPTGEFCVDEYGIFKTYVQGGDICADGSFKIPLNFGWCDEPVASCPNDSWSLSSDQQTCSRPDDYCWKNIDDVSELKLLAAIAYGESHWSNVYEEMAGIASATIRRRDAAKFNTVNQFVKKYKNFSYVVYDGNERFIKLMCGDENDFKKAYDAAENAINYGKDYSSGGCFWDGYDLKTSGVKHPKYQQGFHYSDLSHNIFDTPEPPHIRRKGRRHGYYNNTYKYFTG